MNKKRYAGLYWSQPEKWDKMDTKGIETVRRDNCALVRQVVDTVLRMLLMEHSIEGAISYVKSTISDLLQNKVDLSMLVITKALGKSASSEEYAAKQAHVELAERMRKRDPGSAPAVGDRVPFVLIEAAKGTPAYERSEDPIYVLEHNIPIDAKYYLEHQLEGPITRIFEGVIDNPASLFVGEHTRTITVRQ
jgi:DNA polymerase delta subunit 1